MAPVRGVTRTTRRAPPEHGGTATGLLDGTPGSVAPVWERVAGRCAELGVARETVEEGPSRGSWPSWPRHGRLVDLHPPARAGRGGQGRARSSQKVSRSGSWRSSVSSGPS